ncbi:MAG: co-chaperone GroES [Planctomycetota bacterium]|nr:co-chaperone GroES [Planctomycetota bacterium]
MAIKPLEDRVLVKPAEAETKTASGIYLPEASKEKPVKGEVVAVGPGKRLDNGKRGEMSVRRGDTVVYGKYAGTEVEIKGEKHLILRETELLGVIEG